MNEDDDRTVLGSSTDAADNGAGDGSRLPLGSRLGEFEIRGVVGEGGFSIVYRAWDYSLEREVALKEYMPSSLATRTGVSRVHARSVRHQETFVAGLKSFVNEAKLLAQFDHPALVKVHRFWEANGTAYMVMPLYHGVTVKDKVRSMAEAPSEAWLNELLEPLTQALAVLHRAQCFHRDIAPDNVLLLAKEDKPLLLDFGAARRVIGDKTQALTVILKPGYAPVEQYAEDAALHQGPWTDVYALAAVVHWVITGRTPPVSVGRMINDSYVPLAQAAAGRYSERFLAAVDRALAVMPDRRTRSIEAFRDDLGLGSAQVSRADPDAQKTVIHVPSAATKGHIASTDATPATASGTRFKGRLVVGGAAAALSILAVSYWFVRSPTPPPKPTLESSPIAATSKPAPQSTNPTQRPDASPAASAALPVNAPVHALSANAIVESILQGRDPSIETSATATLPDQHKPGSSVRLEYVASKPGYPYLFVASDSSGRLTLLHPVPTAPSDKAAAKGRFEVASSDWPSEGARTLIVVAREQRDLRSSGWRIRDGKLAFDTDPADSAEHAAGAAWGATPCRLNPTSCDASYGASHVSTVEATVVEAPPIGQPTPAPAPKRVVAQGSTPRGREAATAPSECARILQRLSLGDSSPALMERMKQLGCK